MDFVLVFEPTSSEIPIRNSTDALKLSIMLNNIIAKVEIAKV